MAIKDTYQFQFSISSPVGPASPWPHSITDLSHGMSTWPGLVGPLQVGQPHFRCVNRILQGLLQPYVGAVDDYRTLYVPTMQQSHPASGLTVLDQAEVIWDCSFVDTFNIVNAHATDAATFAVTATACEVALLHQVSPATGAVAQGLVPAIASTAVPAASGLSLVSAQHIGPGRTGINATTFPGFTAADIQKFMSYTHPLGVLIMPVFGHAAPAVTIGGAGAASVTYTRTTRVEGTFTLELTGS